MFYTITSSASKGGKLSAKANVRAVETTGAGLASHLNYETGKLCVPDADAVRECLPHAWRKAWDRRAHASFTFISETGSDKAKQHTCYKPLHDAKGRHLTTIYAAPYYRA